MTRAKNKGIDLNMTAREVLEDLTEKRAEAALWWAESARGKMHPCTASIERQMDPTGTQQVGALFRLDVPSLDLCITATKVESAFNALRERLDDSNVITFPAQRVKRVRVMPPKAVA